MCFYTEVPILGVLCFALTVAISFHVQITISVFFVTLLNRSVLPAQTFLFMTYFMSRIFTTSFLTGKRKNEQEARYEFFEKRMRHDIIMKEKETSLELKRIALKEKQLQWEKDAAERELRVAQEMRKQMEEMRQHMAEERAAERAEERRLRAEEREKERLERAQDRKAFLDVIAKLLHK